MDKRSSKNSLSGTMVPYGCSTSRNMSAIERSCSLASKDFSKSWIETLGAGVEKCTDCYRFTPRIFIISSRSISSGLVKPDSSNSVNFRLIFRFLTWTSDFCVSVAALARIS